MILIFQLNSRIAGVYRNFVSLRGMLGYATPQRRLSIVRVGVLRNLASPTEVEIDFQNGGDCDGVGKIPPRVWSVYEKSD